MGGRGGGGWVDGGGGGVEQTWPLGITFLHVPVQSAPLILLREASRLSGRISSCAGAACAPASRPVAFAPSTFQVSFGHCGLSELLNPSLLIRLIFYVVADD